MYSLWNQHYKWYFKSSDLYWYKFFEGEHMGKCQKAYHNSEVATLNIWPTYPKHSSVFILNNRWKKKSSAKYRQIETFLN